MTDFNSTAQTDDAEASMIKRRAYASPAITYASADRGPEGKTAANQTETAFNTFGPS